VKTPSADPKNGGDAEWQVRVATKTDCGTTRTDNEDACGTYVEEPSRVLVAVADGVSGEEGGETASRMAIDVTLRAFRESPRSWTTPKRLYRAVQQANIEVHDLALVVPELRRMSTTLTAIVVDGGKLFAAHVGDSRLYLIRRMSIVQKTKDHALSDGYTLTRSLGRDLIVAVDRISFPLISGDLIFLCTDGLYRVMDDEALRNVVGKAAAVETSCAALIDRANDRGTPDNLTAAVVRVDGPPTPPPTGWRSLLSRIVVSDVA
jgi:protein phosphatase